MLTVAISSSATTTAENSAETITLEVEITNVEGNGFNRGDPMVDIQIGGDGGTAGNDHLLVLV